MYKSNSQLNNLNYITLLRICNLFGRISNCFSVYFSTIILLCFLFNNGAMTFTVQNKYEFSKENLTSISSNLNDTVLNLDSNPEFDELITRTTSSWVRHQKNWESSDILKSFVKTTEFLSTTVSLITTKTLSTTTTTSTTTTKKQTSIAIITDFNLTEINYDKILKTIKLDYQLKANFSKNSQVYSPPILLEMEINCSSTDSNQFWYRSIKGQLVVNSLTYSTTRMSPYNLEFIPGAYISCVATTVDLNQLKTFYSSSYLINSKFLFLINILRLYAVVK